MQNKPNNLEYDGTNLPYYYSTNWNGSYDNYFKDNSSKGFLKDLAREEKQHWLVRFLNVFLYGGMLIVDWIEKRFKNGKKRD
ncbi:hypothetical protein LCGC14_1413160 [marine sediment metagenome]|uniref:Uncharacterized protein n=1 Tax=marine sediment metagenome TaxID=412755 RepID=A0A0F9JTZ4_9ZZZZ